MIINVEDLQKVLLSYYKRDVKEEEREGDDDRKEVFVFTPSQPLGPLPLTSSPTRLRVDSMDTETV